MKRKGFTLIELLVVIAIISLLVSILLPSLNAARERAKTVMCAMNLKNIGLSVELYIADTPDNSIALAEGYNAWGWSYYWTTLLNNGGYLTIESFRCPSVDIPDIYATRYDLAYGISTEYSSGNWMDTGSDVWFISYQKICNNYSPSQTGLAYDSSMMAPYEGLPYCLIGEATGGNSVFLGHSKKANVLFLDGHVEECDYDEVPNQVSNGGTTDWDWDANNTILSLQ